MKFFSRFIMLLLLLLAYQLSAQKSLLYTGGHLNYARIKFGNQPKLKGYLAGVSAGFVHLRKCFYTNLHFDGYWNAGPVCGNQNQRSTINEYFFVWRLGSNFGCWCNQATLTPYIGFGYNRFINEQDPTVNGLRHRYNKLYIPIGFFFFTCVNCHLDIALQAEWRPDVYARIKVTSSTFKIKRHHGAHVQMPFIVKIGEGGCGMIAFVPFFDWNRFGQTTETTGNGIQLPISSLERWYLGLRVVLGIWF